jgi:hypothetical protein
MSKSSRLWISLVCAVLGAQAAAQDELVWGHSGYVTATAFSDTGFYPHTAKAALNLDAEYGNFGARTQVTDKGIARLALEYAIPAHGKNFVVQAGRLPRLTTLHSDIFGSPAEWGMAVLPLASYNRRMVHASAFNAMDGVRAQLNLANDDYALKLMAAGGQMAITDECALQSEFTKSPVCERDWRIKANGGSYALGAQLDLGDLELLYSIDRFMGRTEALPGASPKALYTTKVLAPEIDYRVYRWGIKYAKPGYFIQAEGTENRTRTSTKGVTSTAMDASLSAGVRFDKWTPYGTLSFGKSRDGNISRDVAMGLTWTDGKWSVSGQRNKGVGAWKRFDTPGTEWDSYSASITYRWQ